MNRLIKTGGSGGAGSGGISDPSAPGAGSGGIDDPCAPQLVGRVGVDHGKAYYYYPCWQQKYPLPVWVNDQLGSTPGP